MRAVIGMHGPNFPTRSVTALTLSLLAGAAAALERDHLGDYDKGFKRGWQAAYEEGGLVPPVLPDLRALFGSVTSGAQPDYETGYADGLYFGWERQENGRP